jgi:hypothetical protein
MCEISVGGYCSRMWEFDMQQPSGAEHAVALPEQSSDTIWRDVFKNLKHHNNVK